MSAENFVLNYGEQIGFTLRELYRIYGYSQYKMSKFEEYDLYAHNKDFLISDNILTFTDLSGKLMALKPDVTLSIVRNSRDDTPGVQKVYYTENVYRAAKGSGFKEIMQAGLECIGDIDDYYLSEVLTLAAESLLRISKESVLNISNLDLVSDLIRKLHVNDEAEQQLISAISHKSMHDFNAIACENGADPAAVETLQKLVQIRGTAEEVLPKLAELGCCEQTIKQLNAIYENLKSAHLGVEIRFDFSLINDLNYYNGIVFQGYVSGVPVSILSGGQYDRLMQKMGRTSGAVGFAVYLDALERMWNDAPKYDVDVVLLYDDNMDTAALYRKVRELTAGGVSVMVQKEKPEKLKYKLIVKLSGSEVETLEDNS